MTTRTASDVTLAFNTIELTGDLEYDTEAGTLALLTDDGPEHLSISLESYDLPNRPGCIFVKDWSEHAGLAASLVTQGLAHEIGSIVVGPFSSRAYELEVLV